ncbi:hypothetical protein C6Q13_26015 [Burkholderia gladioli]|nr:hypothetical protein C6Q13_26015 [Burkholderia gladioli]
MQLTAEVSVLLVSIEQVFDLMTIPVISLLQPKLIYVLDRRIIQTLQGEHHIISLERPIEVLSKRSL